MSFGDWPSYIYCFLSRACRTVLFSAPVKYLRRGTTLGVQLASPLGIEYFNESGRSGPHPRAESDVQVRATKVDLSVYFTFDPIQTIVTYIMCRDIEVHTAYRLLSYINFSSRQE
jgi:hypothetical protein